MFYTFIALWPSSVTLFAIFTFLCWTVQFNNTDDAFHHTQYNAYELVYIRSSQKLLLKFILFD